MLTKKHFEALAAEISGIKSPAARIAATDAVARVAQRSNPRFKPERFYQACNVKTEDRS